MSTPQSQIEWILSFLMILVHRNGGEMTIENLSQLAGKGFVLEIDLQADKDKVILKVEEDAEGYVQ